MATPQEQFKSFTQLAMAASPFSNSRASPLTLIRGTVRTELVGCYVKHSCSTAPFQETGIHPGHMLDVHIPKKLVPTMPDHALDKLEYQGRAYSFKPVTGHEDHSAVWVIQEATSPLK